MRQTHESYEILHITYSYITGYFLRLFYKVKRIFFYACYLYTISDEKVKSQAAVCSVFRMNLKRHVYYVTYNSSLLIKRET